MNPSVATITTTDAGSKLIVGHTLPGGQILTLPIQQESEGFRRVFAHLLAVYQQPERQAMIFEEPEKGIHPGALSLLADTFRGRRRKRPGTDHPRHAQSGVAFALLRR